MLFSELSKFYEKNRVVFLVLLLFNILAYGYLITHWSISIDSENQTFMGSKSLFLEWVSQGRIAIPFINMLDNQYIIPFWNDLLSVILIYTSCIIWLITLSQNKNHTKISSIIFGLIFTVSPLYSFYLRFTTYNIAVSLAILFIALSIYFFVRFLSTKRRYTLFLSFIYAFISVSIYQAFVPYFMTAILLVVLSRTIGGLESRKLLVLVKELTIGGFLLITSLILYETILLSIYHYLPESSYVAETYGSWGNIEFSVIFEKVLNFFYEFYSLSFNFFLILSLVPLCPLILVSFYKRKFDETLLLIMFLFLPYSLLLVFIHAAQLPARTLIAVPLMVSGTWLLFSYIINNPVAKNIIIVLVLISTFFNAQFINRIFYADTMRFEYDKNLANEIYSEAVHKVGAQIHSKPLVVVGKYKQVTEPFIEPFIKSSVLYRDILGRSIFYSDNPKSSENFMKWLGKRFISPSKIQVNDGLALASKMPSYPAEGYIKETKKLIVVKLADSSNSYHVDINLNDYKKLPKKSAKSFIELYKRSNHTIKVSGWAYMKSFDSENTKMYIRINDPKTNLTKLYPIKIISRPDLAKAFSENSNIVNSGFVTAVNGSFSNESKISLVLINGESYSSIDLS